MKENHVKSVDSKYGSIPSSSLRKYRKSIIDKVWLLIPLKEEGCATLDSYIERTNRELSGMMNCLVNHEEYILTVMCLLENLKTEDDFDIYKHDVFRCCELIKKAIGGESNV